MTKLRALNFTVDLSANDGENKQRPLGRAFAFETDLPVEEVEEVGKFLPTEFTNVQVGETIIVYGPGYMRTFKLTKKVGAVELTKIGDQNGPDPVLKFVVGIDAEEVFAELDLESLGYEIKPEGVSVTAIDGNLESFAVQVAENKIVIDIETADTKSRHFSVQVAL